MTNHPNLSRAPTFARSPKPADVSQARAKAGLTQQDAARLVYCNLRAWQRWEAGDRDMHPATYRLFLILSGQDREFGPRA